MEKNKRETLHNQITAPSVEQRFNIVEKNEKSKKRMVLYSTKFYKYNWFNYPEYIYTYLVY